jgi:hypothetical protein
MKLPFTIYDLRFTICRKSAASASVNRQSSIINHKSQSGVALIITLILLSVTLLMALAFLAVSRRAQNAANTAADTSNARLAADDALASAEAQVMANILTTTNPYNFSLLVSTNYINPFGYIPNVNDPTNVNYDYRAGGGALNPDDFVQNVGNLLYLPRVPVAIVTNDATGARDFRYYYDLNRNGVFDPNNNPSYGMPGDPEWIGILERPDKPHGPNNHFIARFLFFAVPIGNGLDLNAIHNQVLDENNANPTVNPPNNIAGGPDGFFRNQGVDSSELNLAAFLADLNTNQYTGIAGYVYDKPTFAASGTAFDDARAMVAYRYANNYNSLASVQTLYGPAGVNVFTNDSIDGYGDGPVQTGFQSPGDITLPALNDNPALPWAGADNPNHFFTLDELFDPTKTSPAFTNRLLIAGNGASAYDRYTFYRMLSQLGTDSSPESGKMNLNYDNLDPYTNGVASATNFMAWTPLAFFTNAADRLLRAYTVYWSTGTNNYAGFTNTFSADVTNAFGITNIPVWVDGRFVYTPAVNRLLQLAANIYDATTTNYYPDVFRPIFTAVTNNGFVNVFITGYTTNVPTTDPLNDPQMTPPIDAMNVTGVNTNVNVYGVPWIIGVKKGFPNFNSFTMETLFGQSRKIQLSRPNTTVNYITSPGSYTISQQFSLGITNMLEVECWNPYQVSHPNPVVIFVTDTFSGVVTNDEGTRASLYKFVSPNYTTVFNWSGYGVNPLPPTASFVQPLYITNLMVQSVSNYNFLNPVFAPFNPTAPASFFTNTLMPEWGLQMTNRLRVVMVESNSADGLFHVIDYVQLGGPDTSHDVGADIRTLYDTGIHAGYDDQWDTTIVGSMPNGMANQLAVSAAFVAIRTTPYWGATPSPSDPTGYAWVTNSIDGFRGFLGFSYLPGSPATGILNNTTAHSLLQAQAPYTPSALVSYTIRWEANDPLVHYMGNDLNDLTKPITPENYVLPLKYGQLNERYMPWGGNPQYPKDANPYNSTIKDPRVYKPDNWDFPTGKLPTVGWLGRVHRGTPWQTVYLKSSPEPNTTILITNLYPLWTWQYWTGDRAEVANTNYSFYDASNSVPTQDRLLFDLFTTAFNDNATRGQLSVNVGAGNSDPNASLASWSALFSGMVVPTSLTNTYAVIQPAGQTGVPVPASPPLSPNSPLCLAYLVQNGTNGINDVRANYVNADGLQGVYEHAGSILRTPALSEQSPFLHGMDPTNNINDEMYEWLPQQMMSLVRVPSPNYASYLIYSYGQALKPAQNGVYSGTTVANEFGLVTNYQVVAEIATRAVVRFNATLTNIPTTDSFGNPAVQTVVTNNRAVIQSFNILPPN